MKKILLIALCAVFILGLAGCGTKAAPEPAPAAGTEIVKLRYVTSDYSQAIPPGNQADLPEMKFLRETLGIDLTLDLLPHVEYDDIFLTRVAANDIGDFFLGWGVADPIVTNGGVHDLTDLIKQYAPNATKIATQEIWTVNTLNGRIYGLPSLPISMSSNVGFVRKDWLDKLGIAVPKTDVEYLEMLRAFKAYDPAGDGSIDVIPFSARANFAWMNNISGMFGVTLGGSGFLLPDGTLSIQCFRPEAKQYIEFVTTMYEEKLLDQDVLLNTRADWEAKIGAGMVGAWNHNLDLAWDWQVRLNEGCPEQDPLVEAIPTPIAVSNNTGFHGSYSSPWTETMLININCKNPEAVVKFYDFLLSEEGVAFCQLGVPGVTYNKSWDGSYEYDADADVNNEWRSFIFNYGPYLSPIMGAKNGMEGVMKIQQALDMNKKDNFIIFPELALTDLENIGMKSDIEKRVLEMMAEIVTGVKPLDYFDEWVTVESQLIKPYLDELNEDYAEWLKTN